MLTSPRPRASPALRLCGPRWWARASLTSSATPAARFCPSTTRCASFPFTMCWCATSRARRTWPTATRAPRARWAWPSPPAAPAQPILVTGIATAMLDSIPIVCITGNVSSKVLGTDAFQEVDITGITLPVTKHNFLINRAEDIAPAIRYAFQIANPAVPARCWSTSPRMRSRPRRLFDFEAAKPRPYRPTPCCKRRGVRPGSGRRADPQRQAPGHSRRPRRHRIRRHGAGAHAGRARADSRGPHAARPGRIPRLASAQPGHDGHARRVLGQSRHSGSRPAHRLRHAVRRSRHRNHGHLRHQGQKDSHRGRPRPRSTRTSRSMSP
jgi:hypothetical protein